MKSRIIILSLIASLFFINCKPEKRTDGNAAAGGSGPVIQMTDATFRKLVFDYSGSKEWKYKGKLPAIIDFYAVWCAPCRQLSPLVEEIAKEYEGKIVVYKVDTDQERELSQSMGITGLPTLLFIPAEGKPQLGVGFMPKESLVKGVNEILNVK